LFSFYCFCSYRRAALLPRGAIAVDVVVVGMEALFVATSTVQTTDMSYALRTLAASSE